MAFVCLLTKLLVRCTALCDNIVLLSVPSLPVDSSEFVSAISTLHFIACFYRQTTKLDNQFQFAHTNIRCYPLAQGFINE